MQSHLKLLLVICAHCIWNTWNTCNGRPKKSCRMLIAYQSWNLVASHLYQQLALKSLYYELSFLLHSRPSIKMRHGKEQGEEGSELRKLLEVFKIQNLNQVHVSIMTYCYLINKNFLNFIWIMGNGFSEYKSKSHLLEKFIPEMLTDPQSYSQLFKMTDQWSRNYS